MQLEFDSSTKKKGNKSKLKTKSKTFLVLLQHKKGWTPVSVTWWRAFFAFTFRSTVPPFVCCETDGETDGQSCLKEAFVLRKKPWKFIFLSFFMSMHNGFERLSALQKYAIRPKPLCIHFMHSIIKFKHVMAIAELTSSSIMIT